MDDRLYSIIKMALKPPPLPAKALPLVLNGGLMQAPCQGSPPGHFRRIKGGKVSGESYLE
jgi:hypothetical protein